MPGILRISPPMIFNKTVERMINNSPAIAAKIISFPSFKLSGLPAEVTIRNEPKRMRRRAMPPTTLMAFSKSQAMNLSGEVGIQPRADQEPGTFKTHSLHLSYSVVPLML